MVVVIVIAEVGRQVVGGRDELWLSEIWSKNFAILEMSPMPAVYNF